MMKSVAAVVCAVLAVAAVDGKAPAPPDHTELVRMARYLLHNTDWASVGTISTLPAIEGFPFTNVKSIVDGPFDNSTGVPYFYMTPLDFTARDLKRNSRATVLVSLQQTGWCETLKEDPEDPRCTRLMLSGKMKKVPAGSAEYTWARAALFARHPDMANYPPDHEWFVAKLKIAMIAMVDWFGGAKYLSVRDYLAYDYNNDTLASGWFARVRYLQLDPVGGAVINNRWAGQCLSVQSHKVIFFNATNFMCDLKNDRIG